MKVIGIDPAPRKNTIIYDGDEARFIKVKPSEMKQAIENFKKNSTKTLLCWDAPLTAGIEDFYTRPIEKKIQYSKNKKPPKGISTMPYATCPHWVITQYCLDLPKVFEEECRGGFKLVTNSSFSKNINSVVEVHPALALWCWLDGKYKVDDWHYKGGVKDEKQKRQANLHRFVENLNTEINTFDKQFAMSDDLVNEIKNDSDGDYLDAYIAWLLGKLWTEEVKINGDDAVILVGDQSAGAILLPNTEWSRSLAEELEK